MNHLLLDERPLFVLPSLAERIGLNEAIVLQQLHWFLGRDSAVVDEDGRWLAATVAFWCAEFPFWGEATVKRTFSSLVEKGIVNRKRRRDDTLMGINYAQLESGSTAQDDPAGTDQGDPQGVSDRSVQPDQDDPYPCKRHEPERTTEKNSLGDDGSPQLFEAPSATPDSPPSPAPATPKDGITREMIESVWAHYLERFGERLRIKGLTEARERVIRSALKAVGAKEDAVAAVDICNAATDGLQSWRVTHPGSTDISTIFKTGPHSQSNLTDQIEWWAGQAETTLPQRDATAGGSHVVPLDLSGVPSVTKGRIQSERRHVVKMIARPDAAGDLRERGQRAIDWLRDTVGHVPVIEDGSLRGWKQASE